jgi:hypothetical protein
MKAKTSVLIVFVAAVFVLATVSHGYSAQTTSEQERTIQQSQSGNTPSTNEAGAQGETPRVGNLQQPVIVKRIGWSWLLITGLIGYLLGRTTSSRRHTYGSNEQNRRDRVA